tara:strand:- start:440 stop:907 length:468 start_codon:yes stop_codon:yes gene_type:complete
MPKNSQYAGETKQDFQNRMAKQEEPSYIVAKEDREGHKEYLFGIDLYNGPIDSENTPEYQQAAQLNAALDERGFDDKKKMQYGYGLKTGQPVDLMFTGEWDAYNEYGDNFKEQMPAEEYEDLYGKPRQSLGGRLKGAIKKIDIVDKLMQKFDMLK